jgi:hypothetical protein
LVNLAYTIPQWYAVRLCHKLEKGREETFFFLIHFYINQKFDKFMLPMNESVFEKKKVKWIARRREGAVAMKRCVSAVSHSCMRRKEWGSDENPPCRLNEKTEYSDS